MHDARFQRRRDRDDKCLKQLRPECEEIGCSTASLIDVLETGIAMFIFLARYTLLAFVLLSSAALAEPIKLKMAYYSSDREPPYVLVLKPFADAVNREAKDVIEIEAYPGGVLGRNYAQQAQMLLDGTADLAWVNPGLTLERFLDQSVLEFPGLFRNSMEGTLVYTRLAASLKGYEDFFVIGAFTNYPLMIHTRPPITSLHDLRGMKFRVNNLTEGEALKALGVTPAVIPVNEVALAIGRGTIDGTTMPAGSLFAYGISRITRFHYVAPFGAAPLALLMNRKKFESLPKAGQDTIRKFGGEWIAARFVEAYDAENNQALARLKADPDRRIIFPPQVELDELQATFRTVVEDWRNKNPQKRELLDLVETEIAKLREAH
jgi:TRAP-type C4-dicarboxylate transport system substrate-binding protein